MGALRDFVAGVLERRGAVVEALEPDGLEVLAPEPLRQAMGWPELARLDFGGGPPERAIRIGLEGDWLDRFGALLGQHGRWAERQLTLSGAAPAAGRPGTLLERALDLPNAVWRLRGAAATFTRCLLLAFRYTRRVRREARGAALARLQSVDRRGGRRDRGAAAPGAAARQPIGRRPSRPSVTRARARPGRPPCSTRACARSIDRRVRRELEPFLRAMRRRLERDRNRVHAYHDDLWGASMKRLAPLTGATGEKADADRRREQLRVAATQREYRAKLDDLRHNYALRVAVEWVQALELYVPVQRLDVLIRRRKGERLIRLDWHPLVRLPEPPPCDWGAGLERTRLVCDDALHLTEPAGQAPCPACGKAWCRACHPAACPRCGARVEDNGGRTTDGSS